MLFPSIRQRQSEKKWSDVVRICNSFCELRFTEIVIMGLGYWRKQNFTINLYPNESNFCIHLSIKIHNLHIQLK